MPFPVDNIRQVCKERGTSLAEIERALKIGNGVIAKWEKNKGYPPYDRIVEIANYLNTPVSRLTGEINEKSPPQSDGLTEEETRFLRLLRENAAFRATVEQMAPAFEAQQNAAPSK